MLNNIQLRGTPKSGPEEPDSSSKMFVPFGLLAWPQASQWAPHDGQISHSYGGSFGTVRQRKGPQYREIMTRMR